MELLRLWYMWSFVLVLAIMLAFTIINTNAVNQNEGKNQSEFGFSLPIYHILHPKFITNKSLLNASTIVTNVTNMLRRSLYLAYFEICTPPIAISSVLDTGSYLTWVNHIDFRYSKSRSFNIVVCSDPICDIATGGTTTACSNKYDHCMYEITYVDRTVSFGLIGEEVLSFLNDFGYSSKVSVRVIMGIQMEDSARRNLPGIHGLGYQEEVSLLRKLDVDKFSVCIPPSNEANGFLKFGHTASMLGSSIRLRYESLGHYYFDVKAIAVADQVLKLPPEVLDFNKYDAGKFISNTGASVTHLHPILFDSMQRIMKKAVGLEPYYKSDYQYCHNYNQLVTIEDFRRYQVALQFDDGHWLDLTFDNTWERVYDSLCFAFMSSPKRATIVGSFQMRGIAFGLDLSSSRLYFNRNSDCT